MQHIRIIRNEKELGKVLLDVEFMSNRDDIEFNPERVQDTWKYLFSKYSQVAYCIETGEIIAVIDNDGYLHVSIPDYEVVNNVLR